MKKKPKPPSDSRPCEWAECTRAGDCPAPKSRKGVTESSPYHTHSPFNNRNDYYWFCPEHAREYNARWDYFSGMSEEEIVRFQQESVTGHRPTWHIGMHPFADTQKLYDKVHRMFSDSFPNEAASAPPPLPPEESKALAVLNLEYPTDRKAIKTRYKELVKQVHPDVNKGDKAKEERFKKVNEAYKFLMNCGHYQ
ncbi:MAG: J domain-containing protein [Alphaproteobacteria bacterium]|nr:J domain-containing protein [Alphaproteobacteria bacterium]